MNSLQWLQFMLSYFLQASLVIGVAWALERWTHAAEAKTRIWTGCFVSLLGLLAAGLLLPRLHWLHPWSRLGPKELLTIANAEHVLGRSLLAIWLCGSCVMLVRWLIRFMAMRSFMRSCSSLAEDDRRRLPNLLPAELLCVNGHLVEFRISPEALGPFCYQLHQPVVFLPRSIVEGDPGELEHVLQHELMHLQTQHPLQLFAQQLVQAVLWFHPLVWISGRRASLVREFVCDDAVTREGASTASYLRTLLRIVEQRSQPQSGTLSIGRSSCELKLRARRLVSSGACSVSRFGSLAAIGVLLVAGLASQIWLPTNPLASPSSCYSPWPSWSAATLHAFNLTVRDFDPFETRLNAHELLEHLEEESADGR